MRKFAAFALVFVLIVYIFAYIEAANVPVSALLTEEQIKTAYYREKETVLLNFLQKHMIRENGEIVSNIKPDAGANNTLSESVGILMNYSVLRDRKDLFYREYSFLRSKLLVDSTYVKWQYGREKASCNAAIDDLRIAGALLDAYDKWNEKAFFNTAGFIQQGLYKNQILNGNLCEFYDWNSDAVRKSMPLCYIDLYNMYRLSVFNKNWIKTADSGLNVINNGRTTETSPLFSKYYDYETYSYSLDEEFKQSKRICTTYSIYTALHLAQYNQETEYFTKWLRREMSNGKLYAWYDPYSLKPAQDMESTAVYALAAVYAKKVGEVELYRDLIGRMLQFMVTERESEYYGGFGNPRTGDFYSFDNLTALWALSLADH